MTRLVVVVPAHDEEALLPACLGSLTVAAAAVAPVPVEIIVVADACTDGTAFVARAAGATVVTTSARNVGRARAAGMRRALRRGPDGLWLATTDADSRVPRDWLRWHLAHANAGTDLVAGTVVVDDWSGWPDGLAVIYQQGYHAVPGHAHGANLGVSAHAYRAGGGFPPVRHSEDRALIDRVRLSGARVVADAGCPVVTSARGQGRAPHGFAAHLAALASACSTPPAGAA